MRALALALLAGCFDSDGGETIKDPGGEVFDPLFTNAPTTSIAPPVTLDPRSCEYARYDAGAAWILIHPARSVCELWLGTGVLPRRYCRLGRGDALFVVEKTSAGQLDVPTGARCVPAG